MNIKIISDGTSKGTKVVNAETGEDVEYVQHIEWQLGVGELSDCTLKFIKVPIEFVGNDMEEIEITKVGDRCRQHAYVKK